MPVIADIMKYSPLFSHLKEQAAAVLRSKKSVCQMGNNANERLIRYDDDNFIARLFSAFFRRWMKFKIPSFPRRKSLLRSLTSVIWK